MNESLYDNANDIWQPDTINPRPAWYFYTIINYASVPILLVCTWAILRSRRKQASDIFVVGEYTGCLFMSLPCATQCLLNLLGNNERFQYGWPACEWEAFMHVSAIMVQFFSITFIAMAHYVAITLRKPISLQQAWLILVGTWILCELGK